MLHGAAIPKEVNKQHDEIIALRNQLLYRFDRKGRVDYVGHRFFKITSKPLWKFANAVIDIKGNPVMHPKLLPVMDQVLGLFYQILRSYEPPAPDSLKTQMNLIALRSNLKKLRNMINKSRVAVGLANVDTEMFFNTQNTIQEHLLSACVGTGLESNLVFSPMLKRAVRENDAKKSVNLGNSYARSPEHLSSVERSQTESQPFIKYCFELRELSQESDSAISEECLGILRAQCFCVVRDLVSFF